MSPKKDLPDNYVEVTIVNNSGIQDTGLFIFIQSQTSIYKVAQQVTSVVSNPSVGSAPSVMLSKLKNVDGTYSFYLDSAQDLTSGRIYFSDSKSAVQIGAKNSVNGPAPNSNFNFDFVELTLNANSSINLDTTQIDQFGMPITVQIDPVDPSFPNGTGIVANMNRSTIISNFTEFVKNDLEVYSDCIQKPSSVVSRLLGPQHAMDQPHSHTGWTTLYDDILIDFFNYYTKQTLYIVANGVNGMEIFSGKVIKDYTLPSPLTDINGESDTVYTVFQFTGTGFLYNGPNDKLTAVTAPTDKQTNVYNVFLPYFTTNCASNYTNVLIPNGVPAPPIWWSEGWNASLGNLNNKATATQMIFACNGVFGDSKYQNIAYNETAQDKFQDSTVLGNIENQLVTMLNRGISPNTGTGNSNLHLRIGSVSTLNPIDTSNLSCKSLKSVKPNKPFVGATTKFNLSVPDDNEILESTISGKVKSVSDQTFTIDESGEFVFSPSTVQSNYAVSGTVNKTGNSIVSITINWYNAVGIENVELLSIKYQYGPVLSGNYAKVQLLNPYNQKQYSFDTGDLGPSKSLCTNLKKGMQMTTLANFSQPMEVYYVDSSNDSVIIHSKMTLKPFNTGILSFVNFYPMQDGNPVGTWNAYSYFFHNGNLGDNVPTIDGRGYAFPFDDNGGYSSDLDVDLNTANPTAKVTITLDDLNASTG